MEKGAGRNPKRRLDDFETAPGQAPPSADADSGAPPAPVPAPENGSHPALPIDSQDASPAQNLAHAEAGPGRPTLPPEDMDVAVQQEETVVQLSQDSDQPRIWKKDSNDLCTRERPWKVRFRVRMSAAHEVRVRLKDGTWEEKEAPKEMLRAGIAYWSKKEDCHVLLDQCDITVESGYSNETDFWSTNVADVVAGRVDILALARYDRAGRKAWPVLKAVEEIEEAGGEVYVMEQRITNGSPEQKFTNIALLGVSQLKSDTLSAASQGKIVQSANQGFVWSKTPPRGYSRSPAYADKIMGYPVIPDEEHADLVQVHRALDTTEPEDVLKMPEAARLGLTSLDALREVSDMVIHGGLIPHGKDLWIPYGKYADLPQDLVIRVWRKFHPPRVDTQARLTAVTTHLAETLGEPALFAQLVREQKILCGDCGKGVLCLDGVEKVRGRLVPMVRCNRKACRRRVPLVAAKTIRRSEAGVACPKCKAAGASFGLVYRESTAYYRCRVCQWWAPRDPPAALSGDDA